MRNRFFTAFCLLLISHLLSAQSPPVCTTANPTGADECANACLICNLNNYAGSTAGFTASAGPAFCGSVENDQWLGFAAADTALTITATTACQNNKGLEMAIYSSCTGTPLACVAAQNGSDPVKLNAQTIPGQTYFLRIDGVDGDVCAFTLHVTPANATLLQPGAPSPIQGPGTTYAFQPQVYAILPVSGATYYEWTAPSGCKINGQTPPVQIAAPGGNHVTVTYGLSSGNLCVAPGNPCKTGAQACMAVSVESSLTTPCINSNVPAADNCVDMCAFCNLSSYSGSTAGYTADLASGFCGTVENNQWIAFVAPATTVTISGTSSNCLLGNGVQLAVYQDCQDGQPVPNSCYGGCTGCMDKPFSITFSATPNETYYLMVDSYAGDQCDFTLNFSPEIKSVPIPPAGPVSGPSVSCPGSESVYSINPVPGAAAYTWDAPSGYLINGYPPPVTALGNFTQVTVTAGNTSGQICVFASSTCSVGTASCKPVAINAIPPTILPKVELCAESVPYQLPWGGVANMTGTYNHTYTSWKGCDSMVQQQIIVRPAIVTNLPLQAVCAGDFVSVCGEQYNQAGTFTSVCTSWQGCDSTVHFSVLVLNPVAKILGNTPITCANTETVLSSEPSAGVKIWKNDAGQVLGTGSSLTVINAGIVILEVNNTASGQSCVARDTVAVISDANPPIIGATGGHINCLHPEITLDLGTDQPGYTFHWEGPAGFSSTQQNPVAENGGDYTVTVTNPVNGCTAVTSATVTGNTQLPQATATSSGNLDCNNNGSVTLHGTSTTFNAQLQWFGPQGFASNQANPAVTQPGVYTLVVTDPSNACRTMATVTVVDARITPTLTISGDTVLNCLNVFLPHTLTSTTSAITPKYKWTGPNGFNATSKSVLIYEPGTYALTVTDMSNGCTNTASIEVINDTAIPLITLVADTLSCFKPLAVIHLATNAANAYFTWQGPGGFGSSLQNPEVHDPGSYSVIVVGPNGCAGNQNIDVIRLNQLPQFELKADSLNCAKTEAVIHCASTGSNSYQWTGPGGFTSVEQNPTVSAPGAYTVTTTDQQSGCQIVKSTTVEIDSLKPENVTAFGGYLPCNGMPITIKGNSTTPGATFTWITANGPVHQKNLEVTTPGTYMLVVTGPNGCTETDAVNVSYYPDYPIIELNSSINCSNDSVQLGIGMYADFTSMWTGPNGFTANTSTVWVKVPGTYTLKATSPITGCTATAHFAVTASFDVPVITLVQLTDDMNSQSIGSIQVSVGGGMPPYHLSWYKNGQLFSHEYDLVGLSAGQYVLIVSGDNGCSDTALYIIKNVVATLDPVQQNLWKVFPNPATAWLDIQFDGGQVPETQFRLCDATGRVVQETYSTGAKLTRLDIGQLPSGVYALSIQTKIGTVSRVITIQR